VGVAQQAGALALALADLQARSWRPAPRMAPHVNGMQVVGLETWLAVDPVAWVPISTVASDGLVTVQATAVPTRSVWVFSDKVVRCDGPGVAYTPGATGPAPCGRDWDHTTSVAPMTMQVYIEYVVNWVSSTGASGTVDPLSGNSLRPFNLTVGEIQSIGALGDNPHPDDPGLLTPPDEVAPDCTLIMLAQGLCSEGTPSFTDVLSEAGEGDDSDCGASLGGIWNCIKAGADIVKDGLAQLGQYALEIYNILPGPVKVVVDLLAGCASFGIDAIMGIASAFGAAKDAAADPAKFVQDQIQLITEITNAVAQDPVGFAREFLEGQLELDLLRENPAQWIGKIGCEVAVAILTAGAGASTRMARLFDRVDDIRDWARRKRNGDTDTNPDPDSPTCRVGGNCGCNSFPTGTLVLMADGTRRPIDQIRPGEQVLATDPTSRQWRAVAVLSQWSHQDDGSLATVTLTDGSTVTATDHHQFWVDSTGAWVELEDLQPGDHLLTPQGVTTVAAVTEAPPATNLVWELDTASPDTFTVHTGTTDLLVHNAGPCDGNGNPSGAWTDADRADIQAGTELGKLDPADPVLLQKALEGYQKRTLTGPNGVRILVERADIERILKRHHPRFFDGNPSRQNTSFAGSMAPDQVVDLMDQVIRGGNRQTQRGGVMIRHTIDGQEYEVFVNTTTGHINHFTPIAPTP
jgi:hypothetical protein